MKLFKSRLTTWLITLAVAQLLYSIGFTWFYIPVILAGLAYFLPAPRLFRSWLSRLVLAVLVWFGVLQLAAVIQFFLWRRAPVSAHSV